MAHFKQLKNGKWQAQIAVDGIRKAKNFTTKTDAKDWAYAQSIEIKEDLKNEITNKTVAEILLRYEKEVSRTKRGVKWEQGQIKRLLKMPLGKMNLKDVTKSDIREWRDTRLESVQGSTVNREMNLISNIFSYAKNEWELINQNPCRGVKRPANNPHRDRLITEKEIEEICVASGFGGEIVTIQQKVCIAFLFAIETAMRASEITSLTWDNLNINDRTAFLPYTKNGKSRSVALTTRAVELLNMLPKKTDNCFGLRNTQIDGSFRKIKEKTTIENLTFHDTRHEAITRLSKKMPVLALARNVGHTDLKLLMTYYNESAAELAKLLD